MKPNNQKRQRKNILMIIEAFLASSGQLPSSIWLRFFERVRGDTPPRYLRPTQREWWNSAFRIPHSSWRKYLHDVKDWRALSADHIEYVVKALRAIGIDESNLEETDPAKFKREILDKIRQLTPSSFKFQQNQRKAADDIWQLQRWNIVQPILADLVAGLPACLVGMTGSGKTTAARQIVDEVVRITGADALEVSFQSRRETVEPATIGRVLGFLVAHTDRATLRQVDDYIAIIPAPKGDSRRQNWNRWYVKALDQTGATLAACFDNLPFDKADDGAAVYLRAISQWLAPSWRAARSQKQGVVVLLDNVWNWDWIWQCFEPLCTLRSDALRFVFTSQRRPPTSVKVKMTEMPTLSPEEGCEILARHAKRRLLSRISETERVEHRAKLTSEVDQAIARARETIDRVLGRADWLPIVIASYAAQWTSPETWSTSFRESFWRYRADEIDKPVHEDDRAAANFCEQIGSDNPDHKNLYYALKRAWDGLLEPDRERYLDLTVFGHDPVITDVLGVLWHRCLRVRHRVGPDKVGEPLARFVDASILQDDDLGLHLHDLYLAVARGIMLGRKKPIHGGEHDRIRDLLSAIGSIDASNRFVVPHFPPQGLGRGEHIARADAPEPVFIGAQTDAAEKFLLGKLPEFVAESLGNDAAAVVDADVGFLACRGQQAADQFRQQVAIRDFDRARALLPTMPKGQERARTDIMLRVSLATPLLEDSGYLSPRIPDLLAPVISQGMELRWDRIVVKACFDLSLHYAVCGDIGRSLEIADQLLEFSGNSESVSHRIVANRVRVTPLLMLAEFARAKALLEKIADLELQLGEDTVENRAILDELVLHPTVTATSMLSLVSWITGLPQQAQKLAQRALASAEELKGRNRHNTVCNVRCFAGAQLSEFLHDYDQVKKHAQIALDLGRKYGFYNWNGHANLVKGWALCKFGEDAPAGEQLLSKWIETILSGDGSPYHLAHYLMMHAEVRMDIGDLDGADARLTTARREAEKIGERYWLAEVNRVQGEVCTRKGQFEVAEQWFKSALEVARGQNASSFELRAATGLARLWSGAGKSNTARELLKNVHSQFDEGFDTPDLVEAKNLLGKLS